VCDSLARVLVRWRFELLTASTLTCGPYMYPYMCPYTMWSLGLIAPELMV